MPHNGGDRPPPPLAKVSAGLARNSGLLRGSSGGGLSRPSRGLERGSRALEKRSVKAIARNSRADSSSEWVVDVHDEIPWHAIATAEGVAAELYTSAAAGLAPQEAARRLSEFGPNTLTQAERPGLVSKVWAQLNSTVIWILFAAAIVKGAMQSWPEFGLVLAVIVVNTAIGLFQEGRAEKAADAIKAMLSPYALAVRGGEPGTVPAAELVPGDVVLLKSGDKVPADVRLVEATNLQVQEAMLTGESVPASKSLAPSPAPAGLGDRRCMAFSATSVVSGQARGVVVATGDSAEIGQINKMVSTVDSTRNNLLHQLEILGRWLAVLVGFIALASFLLALLVRGFGVSDAFSSAVSIAVAIIPEGLPAVVTIVLAIGTTVMAANNAIIRQLPAVETLGSLNIICSDKTGTLTKNEMTVVAVRTAASLYRVSGVGYAPVGAFTLAATGADADGGGEGGGEEGPPLSEPQAAALRALLEGTVLCNDSSLSTTAAADGAAAGGGGVAYVPLGAPTEVALLTAAAKAGVDARALKAAKPRVASVPFESEHKFMATVHQEGGRRVMFVKGAPDRLLPLCATQVAADDLSAPPALLDADFWHEQQAALSKQGLRVLALCRATLPPGEDLSSLGPASLQSRQRGRLSLVLLAAILDPPRPEAIRAVAVARDAGITVKMITGDHSLTAQAIGRMLGLGGDGQVMTGPEVDRIDDTALRHVVMSCNIYARASPENKLRIVRALQENRQVVAMTGDGVNDAPALKAADVGVAMGITGTDVSKEAAKMVLADDNFASIVAAVEQGRRVWDNIRKILVFNLPVNLAQGMTVLYALIIGLPDVLLVNLVTSVTLGLALAAEPPEPDAMRRPPRRAGKRLVGKLLLWRMFFVCHVIVALVIGMFAWGVNTYTLGQRRAEAFCVLVGAQITYFVSCRFLKLSTLHPRVLRRNKVAPWSIAATAGVMVLLVMTPHLNAFFSMEALGGLAWLRAIVCMLVVYGVVEAEKALVDPFFMPILRPAFRWAEAHTPGWLSVNALNPARACGAPRTLSQRRAQKRGRHLGAEDGADKILRGGAPAEPTAAPAAPTAPTGGAGAGAGAPGGGPGGDAPPPRAPPGPGPEPAPLEPVVELAAASGGAPRGGDAP
ncbi:carbonate dehydratase [Raphidocelis subcapitata]|uniref:Carbonate dehydratase n=1 Tax=Raphidocelis subcapitata TaxID=307507 RepID=A0A2V0PBN6_9CHLO|nr:carbonate dehydratase [Raphidocelis subcapitata]|eukprot:GBF96342.1 carbonate dehydratase [Raphidocelis subcapitata]